MSHSPRSEKAGYRPQTRGSFYARVFGWDLDAVHVRAGFWPTGDTGDLIVDSVTAEEVPAFSTERRDWISVRSIYEVSERIESHGGRVLFPGLSIPGVGQLVYCQDNEGNTFGILEPSGALEADVTTITLDE